jgi:hypothetical protein
MTFTDSQLRKLKARVKPNHVKSREAEGTTLHYLEGWHVIAEANRIFGFGGWDRETVACQCVWTKQMGSRFAAAYVMRLKIVVRAADIQITREGSGGGEAVSITPGQAHEFALKAAETDATKRALSTFGNAFGLSLYGHSLDDPWRISLQGKSSHEKQNSQSIDKSTLALAEPKRLRDPNHLQRLTTLPCIICGRKPAQAHHLTFAQPRALGSKSSDEFAVPLCALHHRDLHNNGDELDWWAVKKLDPLHVAQSLWHGSRAGNAQSLETPAQTSELKSTEQKASPLA